MTSVELANGEHKSFEWVEVTHWTCSNEIGNMPGAILSNHPRHAAICLIHLRFFISDSMLPHIKCNNPFPTDNTPTHYFCYAREVSKVNFPAFALFVIKVSNFGVFHLVSYPPHFLSWTHFHLVDDCFVFVCFYLLAWVSLDVAWLAVCANVNRPNVPRNSRS